MQMWVDTDACPSGIKELLFRAVKRTGTKVTLVANQRMRTPRSEFIDSLLVPGSMNVADRRIMELVEQGDLVITADIPLAAEVVARGRQALNPRGELHTHANVGERIAVRNLLDELRGEGQITGGPASFSAKERQAFANQLDRWPTTAKDGFTPEWMDEHDSTKTPDWPGSLPDHVPRRRWPRPDCDHTRD